jgi:cold shock CspA family protein
MTETRHTGRVAKYLEVRGFGFIDPSEGGADIFFHVSNLTTRNIEPAVGDVVTYTLSQRHDGRPKAINVEVSLES